MSIGEVRAVIQRSPGGETSHATALPGSITTPQCIVGNEAEQEDGEEGWRMTTGSHKHAVCVSEEIERNSNGKFYEKT